MINFMKKILFTPHNEIRIRETQRVVLSLQKEIRQDIPILHKEVYIQQTQEVLLQEDIAIFQDQHDIMTMLSIR